MSKLIPCPDTYYFVEAIMFSVIMIALLFGNFVIAQAFNNNFFPLLNATLIIALMFIGIILIKVNYMLKCIFQKMGGTYER